MRHGSGVHRLAAGSGLGAVLSRQGHGLSLLHLLHADGKILPDKPLTKFLGLETGDLYWSSSPALLISEWVSRTFVASYTALTS